MRAWRPGECHFRGFSGVRKGHLQMFSLPESEIRPPAGGWWPNFSPQVEGAESKMPLGRLDAYRRGRTRADPDAGMRDVSDSMMMAT
jgi:hypothetical protein